MVPKVAVIGQGVIGLSSAIAIKQTIPAASVNYVFKLIISYLQYGYNSRGEKHLTRFRNTHLKVQNFYFMEVYLWNLQL